MEWKQKFVTFKSLLEYAKAEYPGSVAFADPIKKTQIKYSELAGAVDHFSALINTYVESDDHFTVSVFSDNCMDWMLVFLSTVVGNNIFAPINQQIKNTAEICRLVSMADIKLIFVSEQYAELFERVIDGWNDVYESRPPLIMPLEETCGKIFRSFVSGWAGQAATAAPEPIAMPAGKKQLAPEDYAILLITSGSINTKGVMHSQKSLLSNQQSAAELLLVAHPNEVFIAGLPLSHAYGLLCGFVPLSFGSIAVYAPTPRAIPEYITASSKAFPDKDLLVAGVPELARIMNQRIQRSAKGIGIKDAGAFKRAMGQVKYAAFLGMRRINYFTSKYLGADLSGAFFKPIKEKFGRELKMPIGGGPIDKVTEFGLRGVGIIAMSGYGTTEMAPLVAANVAAFTRIQTGTVGQVPNGMEITLIDGEVCCRGPNTMLGYLNNETATKKALPGDGWYHTGDRGFYMKRVFGLRTVPTDKPTGYIYTPADSNYFLVLKGRVDNQFANHRGENIYPEVIESLLLNFPTVNSCRVFESPPTHVMAQIFPDAENMALKYGREPSPEETTSLFAQIVKQVNSQLQSGCTIDEFEITNADFERNAFGKIKRRYLT